MNTADQARELWCPMVRIARREVVEPEPDVKETVVVVGGCNTDALGRMRVPASCRCIASQCAMWRWGEAAPELRDAKTWWPEDDYVEVEPAPRPAAIPETAVWIPLSGEGDNVEGGFWQELDGTVEADNERATASRRGYCGLAGRGEVFQ